VRESLYGPESITWRVNQEPALLLGGGRALLMQLAHPSVAAGVAEHSDFRERPLQRLVRTLELTLALTFGTHDEALTAARQINVVHRRVRGEGYTASDPSLLLWVHATLIDSALTTYSAFVRPLLDAEREAYYQEAKLVGSLLGLGGAGYPPRYTEFAGYLAGMLAGDELRVDERARDLAEVVLRPPLRRVPVAVYRPLSAITAGLLPERLRQAYGIPWGRLERGAYAIACRALPRFVAALPGRFRQVPPARTGSRRWLAAPAEPGRTSGLPGSGTLLGRVDPERPDEAGGGQRRDVNGRSR
jgi:uncharacterized protein (DUF2236 family)